MNNVNENSKIPLIGAAILHTLKKPISNIPKPAYKRNYDLNVSYNIIMKCSFPELFLGARNPTPNTYTKGLMNIRISPDATIFNVSKLRVRICIHFHRMNMQSQIERTTEISSRALHYNNCLGKNCLISRETSYLPQSRAKCNPNESSENSCYRKDGVTRFSLLKEVAIMKFSRSRPGGGIWVQVSISEFSITVLNKSDHVMGTRFAEFARGSRAGRFKWKKSPGSLSPSGQSVSSRVTWILDAHIFLCQGGLKLHALCILLCIYGASRDLV